MNSISWELGSVTPQSAPTCIAIPLYRCRLKRWSTLSSWLHQPWGSWQRGCFGKVSYEVSRVSSSPMEMLGPTPALPAGDTTSMHGPTGRASLPLVRFRWIVFRVHLSVGPTGQLISPAWWLVTTRTDIFFLHKEEDGGVDWTSKKGRYHIVLAHGENSIGLYFYFKH